LSQLGASLERQRDEFVAALEQRQSAAEAELRRRVDTLAADAEAQRAVLEARLHELGRRIDDATARAREQLESLRTS
jgi:small-conductance mechanosensitive channel